VQVEDVDPIETKSRQTAFERPCRGVGQCDRNRRSAAGPWCRRPRLSGLSFRRTRPIFFSDSPLPYWTAVPK
jgi:hypothetical protein